MYKPGDIIFVHSYLLMADTKLPLVTDSQGNELVAPAEAIV